MDRTTSVLSGLNQFMAKVKIEPELQINEQKWEVTYFGMATQPVKIEPGFEIKTENFDEEAYAMVDIKNEPAYDQKVERSEKMAEDESTSYQRKTENYEEMDVAFEILEADAENIVDKITVIKRWLHCVPFKAVVEGSPFVPFKMPFSGSEAQPCPRERHFHISDLVQAFPNIGLIIDLSNKRRTYRISQLMAFDVQYVNIPVRFQHWNSIPDIEQLNQFMETCSVYTTMHPGKLIGVHDLLGNRATAYMICKALEYTGLSMKLAMERFQGARGYSIYASLAGVLNGSRRPSIRKLAADVKPVSKKKTKEQRKAKRRAKAERKAARKIKFAGKSKKQRKAERKAMKREKAYKEFVASL